MSKVNLDTIKPWNTQRVAQLLGVEDDVVVEFIFNMLEKKQVDDGNELITLNMTWDTPPQWHPHRAYRSTICKSQGRSYRD